MYYKNLGTTGCVGCSGYKFKTDVIVASTLVKKMENKTSAWRNC